jgi:KaiC/GvpD/RAD55 family RecA-like ATPase
LSVDGAIPLNIRGALDSDTGYVVVVTGQAGTGKSLFVQEVMRQYPSSFMIITDSEDTNSINVDNSKAIQNWGERHVKAHFWRKFESDLAEDKTIMGLLNYLSAQENDGYNSEMIIIDSWTEFIKPLSKMAQYSIQQSLVSAARDEKKKLILVTEIDSDITQGLFHSCDAIINLLKKRKENRLFRELSIEKLRSLPLAQDTYLFTLFQGRFTYIPWYVHQYPAITIEREPIVDPSRKRISTGNRSLDELTGGGFNKASLNLIEVENLAAPYLETIYIPFLSNHLLLGRPAIIVLPEGWSPARFVDGLSHFVEEDIVSNQVVFFGRHALGKDENVKDIDDDPWKTLQEIRYESDKMERDFNLEVTQLFSLDTLENKYGGTVVKGMLAELSASLPVSTRAIIAILSRQQSIRSDELSPNQHLRVEEINGVLSIYGVNPRTNFLAVKPILSKGYLDYELVPIV